MYKIERKSSGYLLKFSGNMTKDEMQQWFDDSKAALDEETSPEFSVIIDMRTLVPMQPDAQALMVAGQKLYLDKGMMRSAVIVNNNVTAMQFKRLAQESGIDKYERYISGSTPNCEKIAISWCRDGVDPG